MYKPIENPTRKQIEKYLAKIDWYLRGHGCEHYYLYNHKKKCTYLYLLFPDTDSRLALDSKDYKTPSFTFYMKEVVMELLDDTKGNYNAVSFKGKDNKSIFILCSNYDKS